MATKKKKMTPFEEKQARDNEIATALKKYWNPSYEEGMKVQKKFDAAKKATDKLYKVHPEANPYGTLKQLEERQRIISENGLKNWNGKKYEVDNREGYPYRTDPDALRRKREQKKLDQGTAAGKEQNPYEVKTNKKKKKTTDYSDYNTWAQQQNRDTVLERYRSDPGSVSPGEMMFMAGFTPEKPSAFDEMSQDAKNKYNQKKNNKELMNKISAIEKTQKGKTKTYDLTLKDALKQAGKNVYDGDLDHLESKDIKALQKAKKDGKKSVIMKYNGKLMNMKIDEALKYDDSWLKRRSFNFDKKVAESDNKLKGIGDYVGDGAKYGLFRALDALGTVGQGVKGYEESMRKSTGIEAGKTLKPLMVWNRKSWKEAYDEAKEEKEAGAFWKAANPVNHAKALGTAADGAWKSLNGYYTKHPEKARTGYKALLDQGWEKDSWGAKGWGFAGDVAADMAVSSVGKTTAVKGGKAVGKYAKPKNIEKAATLMKENLGKLAKTDAQRKAIANIADTFKANGGQITDDEIKSVLSKHTADSNTWNEVVREAAKGPVRTDNMIRSFGVDVAGSDKLLKGLNKVTGASALKNALSRTAPIKSFNKHFNVNAGTTELGRQALATAQGNARYNEALTKQELNELVRGTTKKDLRDAFLYRQRPGEELPIHPALGADSGIRTAIPESMQNGVYDNLAAMLDRSPVREAPYMKTQSILDNYTPGVYKNSEKAQAAWFGGSPLNMAEHKAKSFRDPIEAMIQTADDPTRQGLKAVDDLAKLVYKRESDSFNFVEAQKLKQTMEALDKEAPGLLSAGDKQLFDRYINPGKHARPPRGALLTALKKTQDYWKMAIMNTVPATGMRNLYGGLVNNIEDGVGLANFGDAAKMQGATAINDLVSTLSRGKYKDVLKPTLKLENGEKIGYDKLKELAVRNGIDQGQMTADLTDDIMSNAKFGQARLRDYLNPLDTNNFIGFKPGSYVNNSTEQFNRMARFIKGLDDYGAAGAKQAGQDVRKVHFDYSPSALTNTERNIKDYLIPFYTFQRMNLPYQASKAVTNTPAFNAFATHLPNAFNQDSNNPDQTYAPGYMKNDLFLGMDEETGLPKYLPGQWNSVNEFKDWQNPGEKVKGALSPLIKGAYDGFVAKDKALDGWNIAGNTQSQFGQGKVSKFMADNGLLGINAVDDYKNPGSDYYQQNARWQKVLNDVIPQMLNASGVIKASGDSDKMTSKVRNLLTGIEPRTPDLKKAEEYQAKAARKDIDKQIQDLVSSGKVNYNEDIAKQNEAAKPQWYDVENAWKQDIQWVREMDDTLASDSQGETTKAAPFMYGGNDFYNKATYDAFGNVIDVHFKYATPKGETQIKQYEYLNKMVEEGRQKHEEDMAMYQSMKQKIASGQYKLKDLYKYNGVEYLYDYTDKSPRR